MAYDHFMTPPDLLNQVRLFYNGQIHFDAASNIVAQEYVKAQTYAVQPAAYEVYHREHETVIMDSLQHTWNYENIWLNPPYSRDLIKLFTQKVIKECPNYSQLLYLVNTCSDTTWYHDMLHFADALLLFRGRLKFWKIFNGKAHEVWEGEKSILEGKGRVGNSPRFLNTLFYIGSNKQQFATYFANRGKVLFL